MEEQSSLATLLKWDVEDFDVRLRVDERYFVMHAKSAEGFMGVVKERAVYGYMRMIGGPDTVQRLCEMLTEGFGRFDVFLHSLRNRPDIFKLWRSVMDPKRRVKFTMRLKETEFCDAVGSELCASGSQLFEEILFVGEDLLLASTTSLRAVL